MEYFQVANVVPLNERCKRGLICIVLLGFNIITGKHFPILQNACLLK